MDESSVAARGDDFDGRLEFLHAVLEEWLADPDVTIACGRWSDGALSEILPRGTGRLLPGRYSGCFAGVRELRLEGAAHHVHVDLGRVHSLVYAISPTICFAFRPSFELRFLVVGAGNAPTDKWTLAVMLSQPYRGDALDREAIARFFARARRHAELRPDLVSLEVAAEVRNSKDAPSILECVAEAFGEGVGWGPFDRGRSVPKAEPLAEPLVLPLLKEAIRIPEAALVIFRDRTLVELQTERLDGVHRFVEEGHVSWQIGAFDDHHCHLALGAVTSVLFSAEPVPCQGNRLNYTIWFLVAGACGNPFRRDGYFSIVLNRPYAKGKPRFDLIDAIFALYRRHRDAPWVRADATFLEAMELGPPSKPIEPRRVHTA